ncbi:MAG: hypothetical protein RLZZ502_603 [Pseudomonadota bacterium]
MHYMTAIYAVSIADCDRALNELLLSKAIKDYCPNGLQVEGNRSIKKLVTGVSASLAFIEAAIAANADAVLVHHGLFWKGDIGSLTGWRRARLAPVFRHGLSVFAFHLPLDMHPSLGNNAQWGMRLGAQNLCVAPDEPLLMYGELPEAQRALALREHIAKITERKVLMLGMENRPIKRLAWCTGGGQGYFEAAIDLGVDAFVTGEVSEQHTHLAHETGVVFFAAGHHATERYGVQAVGEAVAAKLGIAHQFIDIPNPV